MDFVYFAYGSNMLTERLLDRCPGARVIGAGTAEGYRVRFCLASRDGSAKAGLLDAPGEQVCGVLYWIPEEEGPALDLVEGHPHTYQRHETLRVEAEGGVYDALTYLPHIDRQNTDGAPYDWYRALCLAGANEHGVPANFVSALEAAEPKTTDHSNAAALSGRQIARLALVRAGYDDWVQRIV